MPIPKSAPAPVKATAWQAKAEPGAGGLSVARGVVKAVALVVGGVLTLLALMATLGLLVESGWVRVLFAVLVMLVIPAVIVDRLLPENAGAGQRGLPSDVFALVWLSVALVYSVGLTGLTGPALVTEGDRLNKADYQRLAALAYLMAGVTPQREAASETPHPAKPRAPGASSRALPEVPRLPSASRLPIASAPASQSEPAPGSKMPSVAKDPAALFAELAPAVVTVAVGDAEQVLGGGTGFLIDQRGTIATNQHVIARASKVRVTFMSGARFDSPDLLTEDAAVDLALLRVDLEKPDQGAPVRVKPTQLGDSDEIVVGERAISIGNPLGLDHTLTDGLISARRLYEGRQWIQTSVPISPGNSGGPLFNMQGEVIGLTTATLGGLFGLAQNLNLAVPVNILKGLLRDSYPGKRKFGDGTRSAHW